MTRSRRMRAAIWLAGAMVCFSPAAGSVWAAPGGKLSPADAPQRADSARTAWTWLKSKAGKLLSRENAGQTPASSAAPAAEAPVAAGAQDGASMAHLHWSFAEIEAAEIAAKLGQYGFALPVSVSGKLSLQLDVGVPWQSPLSSEAYDLKGDLQAAKLIVAGVEVRKIAGRLEYDQGRLTLEHLKFELPEGEQQSGAFSGSAQMQLSPPGELTARFSFARVPVGALLKLAPDLAGAAAGEASGEAVGRVKVDRLRDLAAWQAQSKAAFDDLRALGLPPAKLSAEFRLAQGVLHATDLKGEAEHTQLTGAAQLGLSTPYRYSAELRLTAGKLSHLNRLHPELKLPIEVSGRVGTAARLKGSLEPRQFSLVGGVNARDLRLGGIKLDDLSFTFDVTHEHLHLHPLSASLYGGRADLSLAMSLGPEGELKTGVRWRQVQIGRLAQDAGQIATPLPGSAGGALKLRVPTARYDDLAAWQAEGAIDLEHPLPDTKETVKTAAKVRLAGGMLRVDNFDLALGRNRLAGSFELKLAEPFAYRLSLKQAQLDLSLLERWLPSALPAAARPLGGEVAASAELHGTLSPLTMKGRGAGSARRPRLGAVELDSLGWQFAAEEDRLRVEALQASAYGGQITGSLDLSLSEQGASRAVVNWRRIDVGRVARALRLLPGPLAAVSSGAFRGEAPRGKTLDWSAWSGEASISLDDLALAGMPAAQVSLRAKLSQQSLVIEALSAAQAALAGRPPATLNASGKLGLATPFRFEAAMSLGEFDLAQLNALPQPLRPPLELAGTMGAKCQAQGTLEPLAVSAQGAVQSAHLRLNEARIDALRFGFRVDDDVAALDSIHAKFDDGILAGAVTLPLNNVAAGEIKLTLAQVDLPKLLAGVVRLPVELEGRIDAQLDARIPPGQIEQPGKWVVRAQLDAARIEADGIPLGRIHARLVSHEELLQYQLAGEALEGTLELFGEWRLPDGERPEGANRGHLKLHELHLDRLGALLRGRGITESLTGTVDAEFDYRHDEQTGRPLGDGRIALDAVRFDGERLADRLRGKLHLSAERLELAELYGELAGGELNANGAAHLSRAERGVLEIRLVGADAKRLLFAWPKIARQSAGVVDLDLRTFYGAGQPWRCHGDVALHRGEIGDVLLRSLRAALEASYDPRSGRRELHLRDAVAELAPGRIVGAVSVRADSQLQLDCQGKLTNVQLQNLLRRSPRIPDVAGNVTGNFSLSGRSVRALRDLNGRFQAKLRNIHGLPGSHHAGAYTSGGLSGNTKFDEGELRAGLSRGVVRLERLSLEGAKTQVFVTGTASLAGRLDLQATLDIGLLDPTSQALLSLATQLSLVVAPPVALILEANQFLSNQVIHLQIGGSTRSPTVRLRPLPLLGEEAVRFFLMQTPEP